MDVIILVVSLGTSIASLVCWVLTLIAMFKNAEIGGTLKGVLGIFCPLWAFIWGWQHAAALKRQKIMQIWTALFIVNLILNFIPVGS